MAGADIRGVLCSDVADTERPAPAGGEDCVKFRSSRGPVARYLATGGRNGTSSAAKRS